MNRSIILIASVSFLMAGTLASQAAHAAFAISDATTVIAESANKTCPIMGGEVSKDAPSRQFKGVTIGFCCPGCDRKWDRQSDERKIALLAKNSPEAITAIDAAEKAAPKAPDAPVAPDTTVAPDQATDQASAQTDAASLAAHPAVQVARAYLVACGKADLNALNALFLDKGRATVSENSIDEGTWETYRDHHLTPEFKTMPGFAMSITKEDVQTFGATSIVRQIGTFSVPDSNQKDIKKAYHAAVTYIIVDDDGTPRIAHLHWSSRAQKKPDAAVAPTTHDLK